MKLTKPNEQKLFITRARLWANVYHTIIQVSQSGVTLHPEDNADRALKAFDARFTTKDDQPKPAHV